MNRTSRLAATTDMAGHSADPAAYHGYPPQPSAYRPPTGESGPDYVVGRQFQIRLIKHTGLLFAYQQQTYTVIGTLEHCERAYRDARDHCLAAGWWSLLSVLLMNWIALSSNKSAIEHVRRIAAQPMGSNVAPAGNSPPAPRLGGIPTRRGLLNTATGTAPHGRNGSTRQLPDLRPKAFPSNPVLRLWWVCG